MTTDLAVDALKKILDITSNMLELADFGDKHRRDAGCGVVFGNLRDDAYKLHRLAEKEIERHKRGIEEESESEA